MYGAASRGLSSQADSSRKHGVLDCFTEDLTLHVDELKNDYAGAGYEVKY